MDTNKIITYSLLAHINNSFSNKSIKNLSEIFVPLVKRVVANLYQQGITKGLIDDLKKRVDATYSMNMPYPTLAKIMQRIASEANVADQNRVFSFHNDRSFMIKKYVFSEFDDFMAKQDAELKFLSDTYLSYLKAQNIDAKSQPSIFEFLDKNRIGLSQFFANQAVPHLDPNYIHQAKFIESIKDSNELYAILKRVYLGSIISTYLEVDYGDVRNRELEFLLDTNFIVSLLNLHSVQSFHTCSKIIEQCKKCGYKLKVLNFTVEETRALLDRTAEGLNNVKIFEELDSDSIENACHRRRLNRTDLEKITFNLEKTLIREYGIHIIIDKDDLKGKAMASDIYKKIQARKVNPDGALHDAVAIIYVREKRGREIYRFEDACCWFVIDSKNESLKFMKRDGKFLELIRSEDLINILWMANPKANVEKISEIGLTQLVSITINNSLPNARVLKELDENFQKYAVDQIEAGDCIRLASNVASQTVINMHSIEVLNKLANESPLKFDEQSKEYIEKVKAEEKTKADAANVLIGGLKSEFEKQLKETEINLRRLYNSKLNEGERSIAEKDELLRQINKNGIDNKKESYEKFTKIKKTLDKKAKSRSNLTLWLIIIVFIVEFVILAGCTFFFGWPKVAPFAYFIGFGSTIIGYCYFAFTKKEPNPIEIYKNSIEDNKGKIYKESGFDIDYFLKLEKEVESLDKK